MPQRSGIRAWHWDLKPYYLDLRILADKVLRSDLGFRMLLGLIEDKSAGRSVLASLGRPVLASVR